jgi:hypothetical protein
MFGLLPYFPRVLFKVYSILVSCHLLIVYIDHMLFYMLV